MAKGITLQELDATAKNQLVIKDSAGRAKVAAPSASDDIAIKSTVDNAVGTLSSLKTTAKTNAVAAINELFQSASDGKSAVAAAITGKGVAASGSDTFAQLATKIGQIVTGKKYASGITAATYSGNNYNLVVTGLSFKPSIVIYYSAVNYFGLGVSVESIFGVGFSLKTGPSDVYERPAVTYSNGGFVIEKINTASSEIKWIAFE
ncbi:hypothetical protein V3851_23650 [Paenibacillus sp. M1]|uniref:Tail fiber-like repeat protein n=1 Tax=Paenibacillus haidiansis TaxID=1574488 RepID=A0ABU7VYQ4_9BACL